MVYINSQKYACEACIKGHRSSGCHHSDRPLFEVKKKGRPVSQCEKCRELRKTKRVHSKCICSTEKPEEPQKKQLSAKSKRYMPILPALPNGIKDILAKNKDTDSGIPADPRAKVDTLLNPCYCKDVWSCKCRPEASTSQPGGSQIEASGSCCSGLNALAQAAASLSCCLDSQVETSLAVAGPPNSVLVAPEVETPLSYVPQKRSCCQPSKPPGQSKRPRQRSRSSSPAIPDQRGPSLPPILSVPIPSETLNVPPAAFPEIPPLSSIISLAGTGCTCGFDCRCPGCVEHRGSEHASKEHKDCPDGCGTCVDCSMGAELPTATGFGSASAAASVSGSGSSSTAPSFLDAFFARAAALPPPPTQRASGIALDPTDVRVYPSCLFEGDKILDERGPAFGLVRLPKLECCAGKCGCPGDSCGCGQECNGCCNSHEGENEDIANLVGDAIVATNEVAERAGGSGLRSPSAFSASALTLCGLTPVSLSSSEPSVELEVYPEPMLVNTMDMGKGKAHEVENPLTPSPAFRSCCAGKKLIK